MYTVLLNSIELPDNDIIGVDIPTKDSVNSEFKLEAASISITLNNVDPTKYDPDNTTSIMYADWYNMSCVVIDQDTDFVVFRGKVKQREKQRAAAKNIVKVKADNLLKDILKTKISESWGTSSNVTPSEIIYDILVNHCHIPTSQINQLSFQVAQDLQTDNSGFLYLSYSTDNTIDAGKLINDVMAFTNSHLYTVNNVFTYYQWDAYNKDQSGNLLQIKDIINGTYTHGSDDQTIYNDYRLLYADGTAKTISTTDAGNDITATERAYLNASITLHGALRFASHDDTESTTIADYQMLYKSLASAQYYGRKILQRFYAVQETVSLSIQLDKYILDSIGLMQQIDLTNENYSREPIRVYSTEYKKKDRSVNLIGQWLDKPHLPGTALRDSTPPDPIEMLYAYISSEGQATLCFTASHDVDLAYYNIYISKDGLEWYKTFPFIGSSPVKINQSVFTPVEDQNYYELEDLETDTNYYFKMTVLDTAQNESDYSNIVSCYSYDPITEENNFYVKGDLFSTGLEIDETNSLLGTENELVYDTAVYGTAVYGTANYIEYGTYVSQVFYSVNGFSSLLFKCASASISDAYIQYRTYDAGTYSEWSDVINAVGFQTLTVENNDNYIQIRILFTAEDWDNTAKIKLIKINEVE